jgi:hypothetical protein
MMQRWSIILHRDQLQQRLHLPLLPYHSISATIPFSFKINAIQNNRSHVSTTAMDPAQEWLFLQAQRHNRGMRNLSIRDWAFSQPHVQQPTGYAWNNDFRQSQEYLGNQGETAPLLSTDGVDGKEGE